MLEESRRFRLYEGSSCRLVGIVWALFLGTNLFTATALVHKSAYDVQSK